jgi:signal transduction histidine kinase
LSIIALCGLLLAALAAAWQSHRLTLKREETRLSAFAERAADAATAWKSEPLPLLKALRTRLERDQNPRFLNEPSTAQQAEQFALFYPQIVAVEVYDPTGARIWRQCIRGPCSDDVLEGAARWLEQGTSAEPHPLSLLEPFEWDSRPEVLAAIGLLSDPMAGFGRYLFVLVVSLQDLKQHFASILPGNASAVSLTTAERRLIARVPDVTTAQWREINAQAADAPAVTGRLFDVGIDRSLVTGQERLFAWRRLPPTPLIVTASVSLAEANRVWWNYTRVIGLSFFGLALLLSPLVAIAVIAARRAEAREAELIDVAERLSQAESIAGVGHGVLTKRDQKIVWSENLYRLFGLEPNAIAIDRKKFLSFVHPDDRSKYRFHEARLLSAASLLPPQRFRIVRQNDGAVRHVRENIRLEQDEVGEIVKVVGTLIDETETIEKDAALRLSAQRLRQAEDIVGLGWWLVERHPHRVEWSAQCFRILGLEEPIDTAPAYEAFRSMVHPDDRAAFEASRTRLLETGEKEEILFRLVRKDGAVRYLLDRSIGETDENGVVQRLHGTLLDITDTITTHEALEKSRSQERLALRASGLGAWSFDSETKRFAFDAVCCAILGIDAVGEPYTASELMQLVHIESKSRLGHAIEAMCVASDGEDAPIANPAPDTEPDEARLPNDIVELNIRRADRIKRVVQIAWVADRSLYSKRSIIVGTLKDVTDEKFAEMAASRQQRINSVESLAGGIAHDFNNVLGIILGNLEFAFDPELDRDAVRARIDLAIRAARRAADLTRKLRRVAGGPGEEQAECHPSTVIQEMRDLILSGVTPMIQLKLDVAADGCVAMSAADLSDAIINLAANAAAAMPKGGRITIATRDTVRAEEEATPFGLLPKGPVVEIIVRDTGIGIAADKLEQIFEPFFTTKDPARGSGLGLAIVQSAVYRAGGVVVVRTEVGKGSEFTMVLPAISGRAPGRSPPRQDAPDNALDDPPRQSEAAPL